MDECVEPRSIRTYASKLWNRTLLMITLGVAASLLVLALFAKQHLRELNIIVLYSQVTYLCNNYINYNFYVIIVFWAVIFLG